MLLRYLLEINEIIMRLNGAMALESSKSLDSSVAVGRSRFPCLLRQRQGSVTDRYLAPVLGSSQIEVKKVQIPLMLQECPQ